MELQGRINALLRDCFFPGDLDEKEKEIIRMPGNREKSSWTEERDFFLTRDSLVLFSLDDGYQSQGIQVPVKYSVIADILSPTGPLKSFAVPLGH